MKRLVVGLCLVFALGLLGLNKTCAADFELRDGDRVVLLGDALIEQEQYSGWVEVMLSTAFADRDVTFRNLGWSADTPAGQSRFGLSLLQAGNEPDDEGWKQLVKQIELTKPTVVVFGYGMASALEGGVAGTDAFVKDFEQLIGTVRKVSADARFVFLSPVSHLADELRNHTLSQYSKAVETIADQNTSPFVDLSGVAQLGEGQRRDAIHLNDVGYRAAAAEIQSQLGLKSDWASSKATAKLRDVILRKNTWWFHRSRPANMAYVFGFRKREQGQNAVEIPKFDDLIAEEEKAIAELRKLENTDVAVKKPRTESQYAKFTEQPTPEFTTGEDLEVTLWAENPQLNKPIQINFDPQGRLWVASSEAYPMIEVGQAAPDKILVLEDTNGDGKSDKSTVFAEGLLIPTGVVPGDGGCYVAQSTDLLYLKDTNGDGKADVKKRILNGFGTEDTHHNLHTLRWGPDGRLYMNQSVYTRTDAETSRGVVRLKGGGGFRYNPATMRMEIMFRGLWNSWGHQFDAHGQSFLTDGAGFAGLGYAFPGAAFRPAPKTRRVLGLISPGNYPKFASAEIIYGDSFPKDWQGSVVTCDFRANRVTRFSLTDQDAGFVTKQEDDLLRTSASTFRPIDVKQGPDGALYIADWSNPIINHGEVDFRDERRDRWHGRIWRVSWKKAKPKQKQNLTKQSDVQLLDNLKSDDRYTRDQSRRVLMQRDSVLEQLSAWTRKQTSYDHRLQGLWLSQAMDSGDHEMAGELLKSDDPRVRAAAVRVVADWADPISDSEHPISHDDALAILQPGVNDANPRVRLESVRALGRLGTSEAARLALDVLQHPRDRFIDFALATTLDELADPFMAALDAGQWKPDTPVRESQLNFVLSNIEPGLSSAYLAKYLAANDIPQDGSGPWIELIGKAGSPEQLSRIYTQAVDGGFSAPATGRVLTALSDAQRLRRKRPSGPLGQIAGLIQSNDTDIRKAAIKLAGNWKLGGQVDRLKAEAENKKMPAIRGTAIDALREIGKPAIGALTQLAASDDLGVRAHSTVALATLGPGRAAKPFFATLAKVNDEQQALNLWRGFLGVKNGGKALSENFPADGISEVSARAGLKATKDGGRNEPDLIAKLTPLANMKVKVEKLTPQRVAMLVKKVENEGNPGRGESVYSRKDLACVNCHAIGGVGGKVGPDMTSLGASAPLDYLIESVYQPNAKIKENYHSVIVATDDGRTITGIKVQSTDDELVVRDPNNKLIRIPVDDIVAQKAGKSLMPNGVVDQLSEAEQVDLLKFLSQLGKPGNFDASKGGVGRVYEVLSGNHRVEQEGADKIISGERQKGWMPLMSRVNGNVFGDTLAKMTEPPRNISLVNVYLRTGIEAAKDGDVTISVNGPDKAAMWIDGKRVDGTTSFKTNVKAGKHTVLVRLDGKAIPTAFRLVSRDVTFATE